MMSLRSLVLSIVLSIGIAQPLGAQSIPGDAYRSFIEVESNNAYKADTTVDEQFKPGKGLFEIPYIEIPASDLHIVDPGISSNEISKQLHVTKNGKDYFRFFIHLDSAHLYEPLIRKYGIDGYYLGAATSSTRTVLAWDPTSAEKPIFLKLSLAQYQDDLGRVIPDWEVRRSVGISSMLAETPKETWKASGAVVIPEVMGAFVKQSAKLGFYVDENQKNVRRHGFIVRDAGIVEEDRKTDVIPFFALFNEQQGRAPLIIQMWLKSGKTFDVFLDGFIKEFMAMNSYLFFHEGIIPEVHSQNLLVRIDKKTLKVKKYIHRDVGSMKVDLRLRWAHGLSVAKLRTPKASFDFKFERASSIFYYTINHYFMMAFEDYARVLENYVAGYDLDKIYELIQTDFFEQAKKSLPVARGGQFDTFEDYLQAYYSEHAPRSFKVLPDQGSPEAVKEFLEKQLRRGEFLELPATWATGFKIPRNGYLATEYGIITREGGSFYLTYYASPDLRELQPRTARRKLSCENLFARAG